MTDAARRAIGAVGAREGASRPAHFVQSLDRGLAVIRAFDADTSELSLREVAERAGMTRAAARRFLLTLADLGYVRARDGRYRLTPRVMELGYAYLSGLSLPEVARPHLEALTAEVHESSSVSILDGRDIVYVARVQASRIMRVTISLGTRFPAYATSMGRAILAHLPDAGLDGYLAAVELEPLSPRTITDERRLRAELSRVRHRGWAVVDQELEEGLRSAAAPIRDRDGVAAAAVNVSTHAARTTLDRLREGLVPPLLQTARRIESDLRAAVPGRVSAGEG